MKNLTAEKKNERLAAAAIVSVSLILSLAAGEMIARIALKTPAPSPQRTGWAIIPERTWIEYHPVLGWFHQKNKSALLEKNGETIPVHTNSIGLRGWREYTREKPYGTLRILAAGDSFTFGFGVKDDETFSAQIENSNPDMEVLNLGVAGYGIDQISLLLRAMSSVYSPDIALIGIYPEDFWRATRAYNDAGQGKPFYTLEREVRLSLHQQPVPPDQSFTSPQFPEVIPAGPFQKLLHRSALLTLASKAEGKIRKKWGSEDPDTSVEWKLGRAILKETLDDLRRNHIRPLLILIPPSRWITGTDEPVRASLLRLAQRENVEMLDLTPSFRNAVSSAGLDDYYIPGDLHWTAKGHQLAAREILSALKIRQQKS